MSNGATAYFNLDAENAIIAAMMKTGVARKYASLLMADDFYDMGCRNIAKAITSMVLEKHTVDIPGVAQMLTRMYGDDKLMDTLLGIIAESRFDCEFALKQNLGIVRDCANRRRARSAIHDAAKRMDEAGTSMDEAIETVKAKLNDIQNSRPVGRVTLQEVVIAAFDELEKRAQGNDKGMPSGVETLDELTAGFHKGELTIIAARPAVGKSAFAGQIAFECARVGNRVCICSREMTDVQYGIRMITRNTSIPNIKIRRGEFDDEQWDQICNSVSDIGDTHIDFLFTTKTVEDLRTEVQKMVDGDGLDMLIIDYVQLLQTVKKFEKDYLRVGYISKALKDMTIDFNISIIALAQVGRSAEGAMPTMAELRGSGDLEQDADNVIFLHRPEDASDKFVHEDDRTLLDTLKTLHKQYIVMNIAKQRQGETGAMATVFAPGQMTFTAIRRHSK